jgi:hypothetical protein
MSHNIEPLLKCSCEAVELQLTGSPAACGFCHCSSCRDFYALPVFSVTGWKREAVQVAKGEDRIGEFTHPTKQMRRFFCLTCGETLFGTNRLGMAVIGTPLIAKAFGGNLPAEFRPTFHLFYSYRVLDVEDELPKYLQGRSGPSLQTQASAPDA